MLDYGEFICLIYVIENVFFFFVLADLDKENQDAYVVLPNFGKVGSPLQQQQQAFMGVFDGHGKSGNHCARYARDKVGDKQKLKSCCVPSFVLLSFYSFFKWNVFIAVTQ